MSLRRVRWFALAALLVSGCTSAHPARVPVPTPTSPGMADCSMSAEPARPGGVCARFFKESTSGQPEEEASLATHPTDASRVLVSWTEYSSGSQRRIHTAYTKDAGRLWSRGVLSADFPTPTTNIDNWDSFTGFLPDGTGLVVYGEKDRVGTSIVERVIVARTLDGQDWSYGEAFRGINGPADLDFFSLAVAPDTGRAYLSVMRATQNADFGIWLLSSKDGARTWTDPQPVLLPTQADGVPFAARLAAGPGGLLVLLSDATQAAQRIPTSLGPTKCENVQAVDVSISRDSGVSWSTSRVADAATDGCAGRGPPALREGGRQIDVLLYRGAEVRRLSSEDAGKTWKSPATVATLAAPVREWAIPAASPNGSLSAIAEYDGTCATSPASVTGWGVDVVQVDGSGPMAQAALAGPLSQASTPACGGGNDYAGLSFSLDGSIWAAWADPRAGDSPGIAVAHLLP